MPVWCASDVMARCSIELVQMWRAALKHALAGGVALDGALGERFAWRRMTSATSSSRLPTCQ